MKLSIVIPTLNEAALIAPALERLRGQAPEAERIVADGGSADATARLAGPLARVIHCGGGRGRARQMNEGARQAQGEWLLFLHADTRLPEGFADALAEAERRGLAAGVFRLRIVGSHPLLPLLSLGANLRSRMRRIFLGDQALFIRKELFDALGGFPEQPLLEDYELALLLKRRGIPFYLSPLRAETSGRRWEQEGFFRTWWRFRRIFFHYRRHGSTGRSDAGYPPIR